MKYPEGLDFDALIAERVHGNPRVGTVDPRTLADEIVDSLTPDEIEGYMLTLLMREVSRVIDQRAGGAA